MTKHSLMCVLLTMATVLAGCTGLTTGTPTDVVEAGTDSTPQPTLSPPAQAGKAVVADGELASPYPLLPLGFGGGVSGRVLTVTVGAGETVGAGDLLAVLDDTELQRAVDDGQLALGRATVDREQALAQWERDVADAQQTLARAERDLTAARLRCSDTGVEEARVSLKWAQKSESDRQAEYDKARTAWPPIPIDAFRDGWHRAIDERELAEMRLADAENAHSAATLDLKAREEDVVQAERALAALEEGIAFSYERTIEDAKRDLARAQEQLEYARLTAPWRAIVLSVDAAPGASVGVGVPVVTLLDTENGLRFVTQSLSEQHVAGVYPGQRATVVLRAFPDTQLDGTVEAVVPQVGEAVDTDASFAVHVRLDPTALLNASGQGIRLLPGMTGRVDIFTQDAR